MRLLILFFMIAVVCLCGCARITPVILPNPYVEYQQRQMAIQDLELRQREVISQEKKVQYQLAIGGIMAELEKRGEHGND